MDRQHQRRVWHHTHIEPVLLVEGRIRGVWRYTRSRRGLKIKLRLFDGATLRGHVKRAVENQAEAIARFLGASLIDLQSEVVS